MVQTTLSPGRLEYRIVSGKELLATYMDTNIQSSLTGHVTVSWYAENPQAVKMLQVVQVYPDGKEVRRARALLWYTAQRRVVIDSAYTSKGFDFLRREIAQYAIQQEWVVGLRFVATAKPYYSVIMNPPMRLFQRWPYLDLFQYGHFAGANTVVLSTLPTQGVTQILLDSHDGNFTWYDETKELDYQALDQLADAIDSGRLTMEQLEQWISNWYQTPDMREAELQDMLEESFPSGPALASAKFEPKIIVLSPVGGCEDVEDDDSDIDALSERMDALIEMDDG